MSSVTVTELSGLEVLDSRGRPTVQATCTLASGAVGTASVPSGASVGVAEARELRDGDAARYAGLGCRTAVANIEGDLMRAVRGRPLAGQHELDGALAEADGSADKSRLGANALLAVSLAFARAAAVECGLPLYDYLSRMVDGHQPTLPRPIINLFSGGKHAGGQVALQDVLIVPLSAGTIDDALAMTYSVYQSAADIVRRDYGMRALSADEGGLAPAFPSIDQMFEDAIAAITDAGLKPGIDVGLGIDVAASHFFREGCGYQLGEELLDSAGMIERLNSWLTTYPILSVEDGLDQNDWAAWSQLRLAIDGHALIVGDDLLCTKAERIQRAIDYGAADTLLLKVNQIGTLTEAAASYNLAREAGWSVMASARSGETEDAWLSDLAVGWGADVIKVGSITQSERLAKYNRLLAIEATAALPLACWPVEGRGW